MDKPNANQLLEAINCFEHVSTSKTAMISDRSEARQLLLKAITAHGEAMAAWGAAQERERIEWPKSNRVSRIEDMGTGKLTIGLDSDFDVYVNVWDGRQSATVEFCNPGGGGGGRSSQARAALIKLMLAIEADNAARPLEPQQGD